MIRETIANSFIGFGRSIGRTFGLELAVDVSKHDLQAHMMHPNSDARAWDPEMFKSGNLFYSGYANSWRPIKPEIEQTSNADQPDKLTIEPTADPEHIDDDGTRWVGMKSSKSYVTTIEQDNYAQLMNPKERWKMFFYGLLALGVLQFVAIIITMWATGSFA